MGKGSNVQKAAQEWERSEEKSKTPKERAAMLGKAKKDLEAFIYKVCKQAFMANAHPPVLYQHEVAKHPPGADPVYQHEMTSIHLVQTWNHALMC